MNNLNADVECNSVPESNFVTPGRLSLPVINQEPIQNPLLDKHIDNFYDLRTDGARYFSRGICGDPGIMEFIEYIDSTMVANCMAEWSIKLLDELYYVQWFRSDSSKVRTDPYHNEPDIPHLIHVYWYNDASGSPEIRHAWNNSKRSNQ